MSKEYRCKCGGKIKEGEILREGFIVKGFKCDKCGEILFNDEQMKELHKLRDLRKKVKSHRKVIKIGNSLGVTFPSVEGFEVGDEVDVDVLSEGTLEIISKKKK